MSHYNTVMLRVNKDGPLWEGTPCWEWQGKTHKGYGRTTYLGKTTLLHRYVFMRHFGDIPEGYEIDHKCQNKKCCNPEHLEAVTTRVNQLRAIEARKLARKGMARTAAHIRLADRREHYCKRNHRLTPETTKITARGRLKCMQCHTIEEKDRYNRRMRELTPETYKQHREKKNKQQQAYRASLKAKA